MVRSRVRLRRRVRVPKSVCPVFDFWSSFWKFRASLRASRSERDGAVVRWWYSEKVSHPLWWFFRDRIIWTFRSESCDKRDPISGPFLSNFFDFLAKKTKFSEVPSFGLLIKLSKQENQHEKGAKYGRHDFTHFRSFRASFSLVRELRNYPHHP